MLSVASSLGGMNILLVVVCLLISVSAILRLTAEKSLSEAARTHTLGLALFAGGWAAHRLYWAVNRSIEAMGHDFLLTNVYKTLSWITLIPMVVVVVGAGMILAPVMGAYFGGRWYLFYAAMTLMIWGSVVALL